MEAESHILESGQTVQTHPRGKCFGTWCAIHSQMPGPWSSWPRLWRGDRGIMERQCPCGVGHPVAEMYDYVLNAGQEWILVHGCCGCPCSPRHLPEWGKKEGLIPADGPSPELRDLLKEVDDLLIDTGRFFNQPDDPEVGKRLITFLTALRDLTKEK